MEQFRLIDRVLKYERNLNEKNQILQIGPGNDTLEIFLNQVTAEEYQLQHLRKNKDVFCDCNNCHYRFSCKKGKHIEQGELQYKHQRFNKVILLASSGLKKENRLEQALSLLDDKGEMIVFVHNRKINKVHGPDKLSYAIDDIVPQINMNAMDVQSITNLSLGKETVMCLVANKKAG